MIKTEYNDLFSGEPREMVFKSDKLTSLELWLKKGNYRPTNEGADERCFTCRLHHYKYNADKCDKVGITDSESSNISANYVCDFWKTKLDLRTVKKKKKA